MDDGWMFAFRVSAVVSVDRSAFGFLIFGLCEGSEDRSDEQKR